MTVLPGSRASLSVAQGIQDYLRELAYSPIDYYTTRRARRVGGFISRSWPHVVVNEKSTTNLKCVAVSEMINAVDGAILFYNAGNPTHTISQLIRTFADSTVANNQVLKILRADGQADTLDYQVSKNQLQFGSHQWNTPRVTTLAVTVSILSLGISSDDETEIITILRRYLNKAL